MQDLMGKSIRLNEEVFSGVLMVKVKIKHAAYKELQAHKPFRSLPFSLSVLITFFLPKHERKEAAIQWQHAV